MELLFASVVHERGYDLAYSLTGHTVHVQFLIMGNGQKRVIMHRGADFNYSTFTKLLVYQEFDQT